MRYKIAGALAVCVLLLGLWIMPQFPKKQREVPVYTTTYAPLAMKLYTGGWGAGTTIILISNDVIQYESRAPWEEEENARHKLIQPASHDWKAFFDACESIDIWGWTGDYVDKEVCDGHQWAVTLVYPNRELKTEGSNLYPLTGKNQEVRVAEWDGMKGEATPEFEAFWKAVGQLLGGW